MARQSKTSAASSLLVAPPLPLNAGQWEAIVAALELSPQQAKVVELMLRGLCDKQIATEVGITLPTLRTYFARISARTRTRGRMELAMRVLETSHQVQCKSKCHHK